MDEALACNFCDAWLCFEVLYLNIEAFTPASIDIWYVRNCRSKYIMIQLNILKHKHIVQFRVFVFNC
jgi:hypothetical protein